MVLPQHLRTALPGLLLMIAATAAATQRPGTSPHDYQRPPPPTPVTVSIQPQAWFVERLGGDVFTVSVLVGPGHSPATYEPTPRQMTALQDAAVFFGAGVPFERGLLHRIADLQTQPFIVGPDPGDAAHDHAEHDHGHDHGELDPHTWLDPLQALASAQEMAGALIHVRPDARDVVEANLQELEIELRALDAELARILAPCRGAVFFAFHPAYGHFAARYGLEQRAIERGGREPGSRHLAETIGDARRTGARVIVVQPQFSRRAATSVARSVGAELVELDPLAGDYVLNLLHMAETLASHLGPGAGDGHD